MVTKSLCVLRNLSYCVLASRENEVISKSELLEKVWGYDYYEDANTVNVHIHRIREKLEKRALQHIPSQLYGD